MAELADALDLGSSGRPWGFKSLCSHQKSSSLTIRFDANSFLFYCNGDTLKLVGSKLCSSFGREIERKNIQEDLFL